MVQQRIHRVRTNCYPGRRKIRPMVMLALISLTLWETSRIKDSRRRRRIGLMRNWLATWLAVLGRRITVRFRKGSIWTRTTLRIFLKTTNRSLPIHRMRLVAQRQPWCRMRQLQSAMEAFSLNSKWWGRLTSTFPQALIRARNRRRPRCATKTWMTTMKLI